MTPRGLILDLDDTLYPRERFVQSALSAVARHVEATFSVPAHAALTTMRLAVADGRQAVAFQALCRQHGLREDAIPGMLGVFRTHTPDLTLAQDVAAALATLRRAGWRMVILTNGLPDVQARKVAALDVRQLVDDVVFAEEQVEGGKPDRSAFHAALSRLGVTPDRGICVGDDPLRDVAGARALGLRTIRVATLGCAPLPEDDADVVIDRFSQLPAVAGALLDGAMSHVA